MLLTNSTKVYIKSRFDRQVGFVKREGIHQQFFGIEQKHAESDYQVGSFYGLAFELKTNSTGYFSSQRTQKDRTVIA